MSILGRNNNSENLGSSSSFHEFRKQASFFFKEKIKTARLALTDVTPAQLLVEEATNGNPWAPDARSLKTISKAAFEVDDYWRIVEILHKRLVRFDGKNWRESYKSVIVLEYLLTHGPESVAEEFQSDKDVIQQMSNFKYIDEKGFNWGLNVRRKCEKILKLLNEGSILKEERARARKLSRGIEGFGSFCHRTSSSSAQGILQESSLAKYKRSNSQFIEHDENLEDQLSPSNEEAFTKQIHDLEKSIKMKSEKSENSNSNSVGSFGDSQTMENMGTQRSSKENMAPKKEGGESKPLLVGQKNDSWVWVSLEEENHPFADEGKQTKMSLLSSQDQTLEAC